MFEDNIVQGNEPPGTKVGVGAIQTKCASEKIVPFFKVRDQILAWRTLQRCPRGAQRFRKPDMLTASLCDDTASTILRMGLEDSLDTSMESPSASALLQLQEAAASLLGDLGFASSSPRSLPSPVTIPRIIFDYAFSESTPEDDLLSLLDALTFLAAHEGISYHVLQHFGPLAVDLLARWLEPEEELSLENWETRLAIIAAICSAVPQIWR